MPKGLARGVKIFRRIASALQAVVCVMTRMNGSADFSGSAVAVLGRWGSHYAPAIIVLTYISGLEPDLVNRTNVGSVSGFLHGKIILEAHGAAKVRPHELRSVGSRATFHVPLRTMWCLCSSAGINAVALDANGIDLSSLPRRLSRERDRQFFFFAIT